MSHEVIQLIITKMNIGMKNRSYRYDTNRNRSIPGHKQIQVYLCPDTNVSHYDDACMY